jgi:hypothetical protein
MFTAIIPTLWKSPRITQLIADLCACEFVGEVLVISNGSHPSSHNAEVGKVKTYWPGDNIYVNPSWNYGAEHAKYDNLLICNDDINFNPSFLEIYKDSLHNIGVIGMDFKNYQLPKDGDIYLKPMQARPYGWGCLMLIHKSKYVPIPSDLLIANGDDWLAQHATPFVLHGLAVQSEISTTSRLEEFGMIQLRDNETFENKYKK